MLVTIGEKKGLSFLRLFEVRGVDSNQREPLRESMHVSFVSPYFFVGRESAVIVPELTNWKSRVAQSLAS